MSVRLPSSERWRLAHRLQIRHAIASTDMAQLMSVSDPGYHRSMKKHGLSFEPETPSGMKLALAKKIERLRDELNQLLSDKSKPDKTQADAISALVKAIKSVEELADISTQQNKAEEQPEQLSRNEMREVFERVEKRIDELATIRAREKLAYRHNEAANLDSREGMAVSGAAVTTSAAE